MKIISKNYWKEKKVFKQISIKFGGFYLIEMILAQTVLWTSTLKYRSASTTNIKVFRLLTRLKIKAIAFYVTGAAALSAS